MSLSNPSFDSVVEIIYNLSLEEKQEVKNLLEHNIADARRNQIMENTQLSKQEEQSGDLQFSSNIDDLKRML